MPPDDRADRWFIRRPQPNARLRLFCFSHAGGMPASYVPWQATLGPEIEVCAVQLPGRGQRYREMPYVNFNTLVADLRPVLQRMRDLPCCYFGHSLGALLAFELARASMLPGHMRPLRMFLSGCGAPALRESTKRLHELDDAALIKALAEYNGTPPEALVHPELLEIVLPMVRADFALVNDYQYRPGARLNIPLIVLAGRQDLDVPVEQVPAWGGESSAATEVLWFDGDHFFVNSASKAVLTCLRERLLPLVEQVPRCSVIAQD